MLWDLGAQAINPWKRILEDFTEEEKELEEGEEEKKGVCWLG